MKKTTTLLAGTALCLALAACGQNNDGQEEASAADVNETATASVNEYVAARGDIYATVALDADISALSDNRKRMIAKLIDASVIMDDLFWM